MKERLEKNATKKTKGFSLRNIPKFIKDYAKTCRESYYHMLSL